MKFETCLKYKIIYDASLSSVWAIEEMSEVNKITIFQHISFILFQLLFQICYFIFRCRIEECGYEKANRWYG